MHCYSTITIAYCGILYLPATSTPRRDSRFMRVRYYLYGQLLLGSSKYHNNASIRVYIYIIQYDIIVDQTDHEQLSSNGYARDPTII